MFNVRNPLVTEDVFLRVSNWSDVTKCDLLVCRACWKKRCGNGVEAEKLIFTSCANGDASTVRIFQLLYKKLKTQGKVFDLLHEFELDNQ